MDIFPDQGSLKTPPCPVISSPSHSLTKQEYGLIAIQPPTVSGMRPLAREELHLTLHFLGEVAANDIGAMMPTWEQLLIRTTDIDCQRLLSYWRWLLRRTSIPS